MAASALLLSPRLVSFPPHPSLAPLFTKRPPPYPLGGAGARLRAVGDGPGAGLPPEQATVYDGAYGPWTLEDSDVREVLLYRSGLVTAAASFVAASSAAFLPEGNPAASAVTGAADLLYAAGAAGLGLSLVLIHIYVTPIKRFLQALWAAGALGSVGTYLVAARPLDEGLVQYVLDHPAALWFVGPTFAALTGLVFKEGMRMLLLVQGRKDVGSNCIHSTHRSLLWETGSWHLDVSYPWASSWAFGNSETNH
jgi:uncharacterized integral membrane protein